MEAPDTARMLLTVHYDGAAFHGWQSQPEQRTVQGALESSLSRLANRPCTVIGSGRTDAGVHATGQVASVDMPAAWTPEALQRSLNAIADRDVWVESVRRVRSDFHPRYDATSRSYTYDVGILPEAESPFHRRWCWPLGGPLDRSLLVAGAEAVVGEHSFAAFAKAGQPERGDRCTVTEARWSDWALGPRFTIRADRFLHHMVRYLVGTMCDVARGRRPLSDLEALLEDSADATTSPPAPPQGLFLRRVEYPDSVFLDYDSKPSPSRSKATA